MADGHGGYRKPSKPAPVSGPGAHSRRTDGGPKVMDLPDAQYGEAKNFEEIQRGAPMAPASSSGSAPGPMPMQAPVGLGAPSQRPGEPVTAGANAGPGPDSSVLGLPGAGDSREELIRRYRDIVPLLIAKADSPYSSPEFRNQVRWLIAQIG